MQDANWDRVRLFSVMMADWLQMVSDDYKDGGDDILKIEKHELFGNGITFHLEDGSLIRFDAYIGTPEPV